MFDVHLPEMLALAVIALLVFGPERLPEAALQAARLVKKLRGMAQSARTDFGADFEPHLRELQELRELNPRKIVRDYVLDPADQDGTLSSLMKGGSKSRPKARTATGAAAAAGSAAGIATSIEPEDTSHSVPNGDLNGASASSKSLGTAGMQGTNGHGQDGPAVPLAMASASTDGPAPFDPDAT